MEQTDLRTHRTRARLAFADHMNRLVTGNCAPSAPERPEMLTGAAPRVNIKRMMEGIRKPIEDANLYIVGEAYSGDQGWVEGSLTTAEKVLREYFHLKRADWQPESAYLDD